MPDGAIDVGAGARVRQRGAAQVLERGVVVDLAVARRRRSGRGSCTRRSRRRRRRASSGDGLLDGADRRCTTPSACQASLPTSSFFSGRPNRITDGMPSFAISSASRASSSTEKWNCPGSDEISRLHALARADEQREDEVVGRQRGLAHHAAEGGGAAEAPRARIRERHASASVADLSCAGSRWRARPSAAAERGHARRVAGITSTRTPSVARRRRRWSDR